MNVFPQGDRYSPSVNSAQVTREPRTLSVRFGDGYEQVAPDGINIDLTSYSLAWNNIQTDVFEDIWGFLSPRQKITPFRWKLPEMAELIAVKCHDLSYTDLHAGLFSISAVFKRDYTPGV